MSFHSSPAFRAVLSDNSSPLIVLPAEHCMQKFGHHSKASANDLTGLRMTCRSRDGRRLRTGSSTSRSCSASRGPSSIYSGRGPSPRPWRRSTPQDSCPSPAFGSGVVWLRILTTSREPPNACRTYQKPRGGWVFGEFECRVDVKLSS